MIGALLCFFGRHDFSIVVRNWRYEWRECARCDRPLKRIDYAPPLWWLK